MSVLASGAIDMMQSMTQHTQAHHFWQHFVDQYWESGPVLLSANDTQFFPKISKEALFCAVVACVNDFLQGNSQKVRFYEQLDLLRGGNRSFLPTLDEFCGWGYAKMGERPY